MDSKSDQYREMQYELGREISQLKKQYIDLYAKNAAAVARQDYLIAEAEAGILYAQATIAQCEQELEGSYRFSKIRKELEAKLEVLRSLLANAMSRKEQATECRRDLLVERQSYEAV